MIEGLQIDPEDEHFLIEHSWYARVDGQTTYAQGHTPNVNGGQMTLLLHRLIMGVPSGTEVDHRDGNGLNNRRSNLRIANRHQQNCNVRPQVGRSSRFKGVSWHKVTERWQARIAGQYLGCFDSEEEAARAYDRAAQALFGEFARPNGWEDG